MDYVITNFSLIETQTINWTINMTTKKFTGFTYGALAEMTISLLFVPVLCVFGIVGNILSIIVLNRDDVMKKTTRFLLQNVAVADIGLLISCIFVMTW